MTIEVDRKTAFDSMSLEELAIIEDHRPTLMYQSTLTVTMSGALASKGKGQWILDDVDNIGVLRLVENEQEFGVTRQRSYDKTGIKHCRPLYLYCPDSLFAPNLNFARFHDLDRLYPLKKFAAKAGTTVLNFIRSKSQEHNVWSLYGPNVAVVSIKMEQIRAALHEMIDKYRNAVLNSLVTEKDKKDALERFHLYFGNPDDYETLNDYSKATLQRMMKHCFNEDVEVKSFALDLLSKQSPHLLEKFVQRDRHAIETYNIAAAMHNSHLLSEEAPNPYYKINLKTGERKFYDFELECAENELLVNKILCMENIHNLGYESYVMEHEEVKARDYAYHHLPTGTNQLFYETNWLEATAGIKTLVKVPELFQGLFGYSEMPLDEFVNTWHVLDAQIAKQFADAVEARQRKGDPDYSLRRAGLTMEDLWVKWVFKHTLRELMFSRHPGLFYSIAGEHWVDQLHIRRCFRYRHD